VENFAHNHCAPIGFERELFVLSSSEFITATVIVQDQCAKHHLGDSLLGAGFERLNEVTESRCGQEFLRATLAEALCGALRTCSL
jgi:hypothetical protein